MKQENLGWLTNSKVTELLCSEKASLILRRLPWIKQNFAKLSKFCLHFLRCDFSELIQSFIVLVPYLKSIIHSESKSCSKSCDRMISISQNISLLAYLYAKIFRNKRLLFGTLIFLIHSIFPFTRVLIMWWKIFFGVPGKLWAVHDTPTFLTTYLLRSEFPSTPKQHILQD